MQFTLSSIPILVHALRAHVRAALVACSAQHVAIPTISQFIHFREGNSRDSKSNHKIHENIVPRKFGAIQLLVLPMATNAKTHLDTISCYLGE